MAEPVHQLGFITKMMKQRPKPKSPVPAMKKMTKVVEAMGKHVGGYEIRPDGAVRVIVTKEGQTATSEASTADAEWWEKKVLKNGQA